MALIRRPGVSALLLLAAYGVLSLLIDPRGYLGTDTGAKVATLSVMDAQDSWQPDVGYWAEEWDPSGHLHPLYDTRRVDSGWVNVTTLPMLEAAHPLYDLGGYRLALLLPMLGAVAAALCARTLARRLGSEGNGDAAFWLVGLSSPMVVYALDLWEHAIGVALILGGVLLLVRRLGEDASWRAWIGAGACFGAAATMRTEAFVYTLVAVGAAVLWQVSSRRFVHGVRLGALAVAGFAVPWAANAVLESALSGQSRASRATGAASSRADDLGIRLEEAVRTTFDLGSSGAGAWLLAGVLAAGLIIFVVRLARPREELAERLALVAVALYIVRWIDGPSFVSGFLAAFPMAAAGLGRRWRDLSNEARYVLVVAVAALPLVWLFQYTGGAGPQWGGRYVLPSAVLLGTTGIVGVLALGRPRITGLLVGSSLLISALGVAWLSERSHSVGRAFDALAEAPDDVVIVPNGFLAREGGAAALERHYLSVGRGATVEDAVAVVQDAGLDGFALFEEADRPVTDIEGTTVVGERPLDLVGVEFVLRSYRFQP